MRFKFIGIVFVVFLAQACNQCGICDGCPPETANDEIIIVFDKEGPDGFDNSDLDTLRIYRYLENGTLLDSFIRSTSRDYMGMHDPEFEAGMLDNFHRGRHASFYELKIGNLNKKYVLKDFHLDFIPRDPESCCGCDKSNVLGMTVNDSVMTDDRLPYRISK